MTTISIDKDLSHYAEFFDDTWANNLMELTRGTDLYKPIFDLAVSWKAQSSAHAMPWILVHSIQALWDESAKTPKEIALRLTRSLHRRLVNEVVFTTRGQGRQVEKIMADVGKRYEEYDPDGDAITPQKTWLGLCDKRQFHLSIHASQRNCFSTLYHDYENFLRRVIQALNRGVAIRIGNAEMLEEKVTEFLGQAIANSCVSCTEIAIPRLIRNAFAHTGGAETRELRQVNHGFRIHDGIVQVLAADTVQLYRFLKEAVERVVKEALQRLSGQPA